MTTEEDIRDRLEVNVSYLRRLQERIEALEKTVAADAELQSQRAPLRLEAFDRIASALETIGKKMEPSVMEPSHVSLEGQHGHQQPRIGGKCTNCGTWWSVLLPPIS